MRQALQGRDIPVKISNHAGTYICNHLFYAARHFLEQRATPIPCGFIHVPAISEGDDTLGLPLAIMIEAVETCLTSLRESSQ
jgi:pyroglutamyl-peptidase